jgi:hypothetical protein
VGATFALFHPLLQLCKRSKPVVLAQFSSTLLEGAKRCISHRLASERLSSSERDDGRRCFLLSTKALRLVPASFSSLVVSCRVVQQRFKYLASFITRLLSSAPSPFPHQSLLLRLFMSLLHLRDGSTECRTSPRVSCHITREL